LVAHTTTETSHAMRIRFKQLSRYNGVAYSSGETEYVADFYGHRVVRAGLAEYAVEPWEAEASATVAKAAGAQDKAKKAADAKAKKAADAKAKADAKKAADAKAKEDKKAADAQDRKDAAWAKRKDAADKKATAVAAKKAKKVFAK